jgi:hypothetical protein
MAPAIDSDEVIDLLRTDPDLSRIIDLLCDSSNYTRNRHKVKVSIIGKRLGLNPMYAAEWLDYLRNVARHYCGEGPMPRKHYLRPLDKPVVKRPRKKQLPKGPNVITDLF